MAPAAAIVSSRAVASNASTQSVKRGTAIAFDRPVGRTGNRSAVATGTHSKSAKSATPAAKRMMTRARPAHTQPLERERSPCESPPCRRRSA